MLHGVLKEDTAVSPPQSCPCSHCSRSLPAPAANLQQDMANTASIAPAPGHIKHTAAPQVLNLDHETTRRTQGKQQHVQETPAVSHASSAENVSPQLLLWAPPFHRITKYSELESDHRVQLLVLHRVPRESHCVPESAVQKLCEPLWTSLGAVTTSLRSPFQCSTTLCEKSLPLKSNLNLPWHNFGPFPPPYV